MSMIDFFVKNPAKVAVGVLLMALFGLVALRQMPMQLTPEVQTPTITVETRWPGASPQEVEQEIVVEQEEQLKGVEGVAKMTSESSDSMGRITLEFLVGTDMQKAVVDVIGRLEQVPEYPQDADKPVISTANANDRPIAWFILGPLNPSSEELLAFAEKHPDVAEKIEKIRTTSNTGLAMLRLRMFAKEYPAASELLPPPGLDVPKMRRFAEDEIEAKFERVPGVSQSNVLGGLEDELQVVIDPERLAARQLTIADVRDVLRQQNEDTSGGDYWEGKRRWVVRTLGQFRDPQQVEQQLLAVRDGNPVYVRDVADVRLGYKKPDGLVRRFGESSIAVNALRETAQRTGCDGRIAGGQRGVESRHPQGTGITTDAGLRRDHIYPFLVESCPAKYLYRRRFDDGGADDLFASGDADVAGCSVDHCQRAGCRLCLVLVFYCDIGDRAWRRFLVRTRCSGCRLGNPHQYRGDIPDSGHHGAITERYQSGRFGVCGRDVGR